MRLLLLGALTMLLANCASVSTLQTARVLDEGDSFHSIGLSLYSSDDFIGGDDISLPLIEYTYRRGVWEDIDFGIKLALIGASVIDMKYNLISDDKLALATGVGIGYLSYTSTVNGQDSDSTIIDFILPLYLSYDIGEKTTLYSAAKYMFRTISNDVVSTEDDSLVSATGGVQLGRKSGVFLEASLISSLDTDFSGTQFNGSYFFRF